MTVTTPPTATVAARSRLATAAEHGVVLAIGVAGSLAADRWLPLPVSDALRTSLATLPLVLAGLFALGRAAKPGRRLAAASWLELGLLAVLVVAAVCRERLGLGLGAPVVAAGLAGLLLAHAARRLLSLRRLLGRRVPHRPPLVFFCFPLVIYLALLPWTTGQRPPDGDEPYYLLVAHSLAHDFDSELTNNYAAGDWRGFLARPLEPQPGDPRGPHGEIYSRHDALLPAALVPAYVLGGKLGALAAMAAFAAALAWLTLRLASHYVPDHPGETLIAYGLLILASPLLLFSTQVWVEVPAALLSMVALEQSLRLRKDRAWTSSRWLALAVPLVLLPLLKIRLLLLAGPLLVLAWWHAGRPRRPLLLMAGALGVVGASILLYNRAAYGNPLKIHNLDELRLDRYPLTEITAGVSGLLWDAAFGLFAAFPIWLLLLPAVLLLARQRHYLLRDLGFFLIPYLLIVAPRSEWYGGWSPPFRYAMVALPLLALLLVPLLAERTHRGRRRAGARTLWAPLLAATAVLTVLWIAMPGWTYNFADGRTYLLDHLAERLGADVARFFPSTIRPRMATWVWPLLTVVLVPLVWWRPRRRLRMAGQLGVALMFFAAACLPLAARRLPTTVVEVEDPWVRKTGGHLHPDRWVVDRTRYRGGWVLREGEVVTVPVVAGGDRLELALDVMYVRNADAPLRLSIAAGDVELGSWLATDDRSWRTLTLGPFSWPSGAPLALRLTAPAHQGDWSGVIFDQARLTWR